jgi:hypothetical protein
VSKSKTITKKIPQNAGKAPSIQLYYKDWLSDSRLQLASKRAKGVWIDLIAISCDMPVPGVFRVEKRSFSCREVVDLLSGSRRENRQGVVELIEKGIIKQDEDGTFYVKRVKRDMELREIRRACGKMGGNPNLLNQDLKQNDNQNLTPSSSSSTSVKKTFELDSVEYRLATLLFSEIQKRKPDHTPPNLQIWAKHIDYMIRVDNRKPENIEKVIVWVQRDEGDGGKWKGWQDNIMCTEKLRKHFDQLEIKMQKQAPAPAIKPLQRDEHGMTPGDKLRRQLAKQEA